MTTLKTLKKWRQIKLQFYDEYKVNCCQQALHKHDWVCETVQLLRQLLEKNILFQESVLKIVTSGLKIIAQNLLSPHT